MRKRLEARLDVVKASLREIERDDQALRLKKYFAEGQQIALQDALGYLTDSEKEKQNV